MSDDSTAQPSHPESLPGDLRQLSALLLEAEPAFVLDLRGQITEINTAAEEAYGLKRQQLLGKPFTTLVTRSMDSKTISLTIHVPASSTRLPWLVMAMQRKIA